MREIIAIVSPCGGQGATTVAAHLAHGLALQGGRSLLFCANGIEADILAAEGDLRAAANQEGLRLGPARASGVDLLLAGQPAVAAGNEAETLQEALATLPDTHASVVLDLSGGLPTGSLSLCRHASTRLVVARAETRSIRALPRLLRRLREEAQDGWTGLLLNAFEAWNERQVALYETLRRTLPASGFLDTVVPWDERFDDFFATGRPITETHPDSRGARAIFALLGELTRRRLVARARVAGSAEGREP